MLDSAFIEVSLGLVLGLQLYAVWSVHFVFFRRARSRYLNFRDRAQVLSRLLTEQEQPQVFYRMLFISCAAVVLYLRTLSVEPGSIYFRQVLLEEGVSSMLTVAYALVCALAALLGMGSGQRRSGGAGQDFFTSVWLLALLSPLAYLASNLTCFFLALEALSASAMYMLVSSRGSLASSQVESRVARQLAGSVFFHFWSSFFSSALLVYSIVSMLMAFGTTEWASIDFLLGLSLQESAGPSVFQLRLSSYSLLLAVLLKLGASPFFFFKLEVYRGLPLVPLVFYSVFYFFVFNSLFFFLLAYSAPSLLGAVSPGLGLGLLVSVAYLGAALFSLPLLRSFFALSSAVGGVLVFFLLLCFFF